MRKVYLIPVEFSKYGVMHVRADSLEEAKEKALYSEGLPEESEYLEDSIRIDYESPFYGQEVDE